MFRKVILVLALVAVLGTVAWGAAGDDIDAAVDANRSDQISTTQNFLKIESYNAGAPLPADGVVDSMSFILAKAEAMGFKTVEHAYDPSTYNGPLYGYVEFGPENAPEMIMSLAHLDTVPPGNLGLWTLAGPYDGEIVNVNGEQHIIGRGAFDDKGPAMATLYALKAIKDSGITLDRRIRLFFGTTEDNGGWRCTSAYAADARAGKEEWPVLGFSPDSGSFRPTFIEKTSVGVTVSQDLGTFGQNIRLTYLNGGTASNAVSDKCVAVLEGETTGLAEIRARLVQTIHDEGWDLTALPISMTDGSNGVLSIDVTGRPAHSGQAWMGIGANNRMLRLLSTAGTAEEWEKLAEKLTVLLPSDDDRTTMGDSLGINEGPVRNGVDEYDNVSVNTGLLQLGRSSTLPTTIYVNVNIRYAGPGADDLVPANAPHQTGAEIREKVDAKFAGITHTMSGGGEPYTVPVDSDIMLKLQQAYKDITGNTVEPSIVYGGTYAAAWSSSKLTDDPDETETFGIRMVSWGIDGGIGMHEANESMGVEKLIEGTKIMAQAMVYLATDEDSKQPGGSGGCNAAGLGAVVLLAACAHLFKYRKR